MTSSRAWRFAPPRRTWFAVGAVDAPGAGREAELAALPRAAGTAAEADEIAAASWMKPVRNCTTLVAAAILGLSMRAATRGEGMREVVLAAGAPGGRAFPSHGWKSSAAPAGPGVGQRPGPLEVGEGVDGGERAASDAPIAEAKPGGEWLPEPVRA